jgi:hypothetical protein
MNFSLSKPDFTKYFASKTKYSITITADDSSIHARGPQGEETCIKTDELLLFIRRMPRERGILQLNEQLRLSADNQTPKQSKAKTLVIALPTLQYSHKVTDCYRMH